MRLAAAYRRGVPGLGLVDENVVGRDAINEAAGIREQQIVRMPLDVNGAELGEIAVQEGVEQRLAKGDAAVVRDGQADHAHEGFLFFHAGVEAFLNLLNGFQERFAEEIVHADIGTRSD